jgi:hypothetical protein
MSNLRTSAEAGGLDDTGETALEAHRQLAVALHAAGVYRTLISTEDADSAVTAILVTDGMSYVFADSGDTALLPASDATRAIESALRQRGVEAAVSVTDVLDPDAALRVALRSASDAFALANLILDNLPEPYAAAHRLRTVLAGADIEAASIRVRGDAISIGQITAEEALVLGEVLHGDSWLQELDLDDWRDLEKLADGLSKALAVVSGDGVSVDADPRCSRCCGVHEVTVGRISSQQAQRLADRVAATECLTEPTPDPPDI